jgi:hypothetical protein
LFSRIQAGLLQSYLRILALGTILLFVFLALLK